MRGKGGTHAKDEAGRKGERERVQPFLFFTFDEADRERVGHRGRSDRSLQGTGRVDVAQEEDVVGGGGGGSERAAASFCRGVVRGGGGCEKEREKVSRKEKKKKKRKRDDKVINAREIKALSFSLCLSLPLSLPPRTHM